MFEIHICTCIQTVDVQSYSFLVVCAGKALPRSGARTLDPRHHCPGCIHCPHTITTASHWTCLKHNRNHNGNIHLSPATAPSPSFSDILSQLLSTINVDSCAQLPLTFFKVFLSFILHETSYVQAKKKEFAEQNLNEYTSTDNRMSAFGVVFVFVYLFFCHL